MTLEEIQSLNTPSLHAKYLELLNEKRLSLKSYEVKYNTLLKKKWLWYTDKLSKEEIDELGWSYDPFECVDALKEILNIITWRHQSIKNAIDWLKFTNPAG